MNDWLGQVGGLINLTIEEREEINGTGAKLLRDNLSEKTAEKHYQEPAKNGKGHRKVKHLADSVVVGQLEGRGNGGDVAVGFTKVDANHARIARFLNDGTVKLHGDHFWDDAIEDAAASVHEAQATAIKNVQERKMNG